MNFNHPTLREGFGDVVTLATSGRGRTSGTRRARSASGSGCTSRSRVAAIGAVDGGADDSRDLSRNWQSVGKVLSDVGHRDVVEGDVAQMALTESERVPNLNVTLLDL